MKLKSFSDEQITEVKSLLYQAFLNHPHGDPKRGPTEHKIVEKLVQDSANVASMVAIDNNKIVGFITYSKVSFDNDMGEWVGLGPIAVLPEYQGRGVGKVLIKESMRIINEKYEGCVVMGEPSYYLKFGFKVVEGLFFEGVPQEFFLTTWKNKDIKPQGAVSYHSAFFT